MSVDRQLRPEPLSRAEPATVDPAGTPDLSVIVVSWNGREFLPECLNALKQGSSSLSLEVIVVDNHSTDGSVELIRQGFPWVRLLCNDRNLGCTVAFNQGLAASRGHYILLSCSDTLVKPGALDTLVAFLESHPEVGAVAPQLQNLDGTIQPSCRTFPTFQTFLWEFTGLSRLFPRSPIFGRWRMGDFDHAYCRQVDQPRGSSLMIRRQVLEEVGPMDPRFFMFFSDVDWCLRIKAGGWPIYFVPQAQFFHHGGGSVRKVRSRMICSSHYACYLFFRKHRCHLLGYLATGLLGLMLLLSVGFRAGFACLSALGATRTKNRPPLSPLGD